MFLIGILHSSAWPVNTLYAPTHTPALLQQLRADWDKSQVDAGRTYTRKHIFCMWKCACVWLNTKEKKDTQAVVHVLKRLFISTKTCLDQLVDEVHLQTVDQGSAICYNRAGRGMWQKDKPVESISTRVHYQSVCVGVSECPPVPLPPVSLSSTRISNFSSLQGISGSSPITVKVASNSPSTRNFTRPLAT